MPTDSAEKWHLGFHRRSEGIVLFQAKMGFWAVALRCDSSRPGGVGSNVLCFLLTFSSFLRCPPCSMFRCLSASSRCGFPALNLPYGQRTCSQAAFSEPVQSALPTSGFQPWKAHCPDPTSGMRTFPEVRETPFSGASLERTAWSPHRSCHAITLPLEPHPQGMNFVLETYGVWVAEGRPRRSLAHVRV